MIGNWFIAVSLFFFAMSTIVGWYFFAAQNVRYLFGEKPIVAYRILVMALVVVASIVEVPLIWELADTFNFFIVIHNVIAILWLSPKVVAELKRMRHELKVIDRRERKAENNDLKISYSMINIKAQGIIRFSEPLLDLSTKFSLKRL